MLQAYVSSHYWWLFSFVFTANCFSALFGRFLIFYVDRNSFLSISCDPFNPFSTNVLLLDPLKASLLEVTKMQKNFFETFLTEGFSLKAKDIFGPKNAKLQNFNRRDMGWRRVTVKGVIWNMRNSHACAYIRPQTISDTKKCIPGSTSQPVITCSKLTI